MGDSFRAALSAVFAALTLVACESSVVCGTGTHESNGSCVPDELFCAPGTHLEATGCVACGNGSRYDPDAGVCVPLAPGPRYEIRVGEWEILANGYSRIPVLVIGTAGSGEPITGETLFLGVESPDRGGLEPESVLLGPLGAEATFLPCNSAIDAGCAGTAHLTASTDAGVVARSVMLTVIPPEPVGSAEPCLRGGNVLFLDGDPADPIHPGRDTIVDAGFSVVGSGNETQLSVDVFPDSSAQGSWYGLLFSTFQLGAMRAQVYDGAERAVLESPGHPGLHVAANGRGCTTVEGRFQVHSVNVVNAFVHEFTATFEQSCEGHPLLRGCVHFMQ